MKAMFVNEDFVPYAQAIAQARKPYETRSRDMLAPLVGERVAVVSTKRGRAPMVVGFCDVTEKARKNWVWLEEHRGETLIPEGSTYDTPIRWVYTLTNAHACTPFPLPKDTVRHGRSWCEFSTTRNYIVEYTMPGSRDIHWCTMEAQMPDDICAAINRAGRKVVYVSEI